MYRKGQALVEFAIISFILVMMVAGFLGLLVLGLNSFQTNIAAENIGRTLDGNDYLTEANFRMHFSDSNDPEYIAPDDDFENITAKHVYRFLNEFPITDDEGNVSYLYDESRLIIADAEWESARSDANPFNLSEINRALLNQYIHDEDLNVHRYPGAVVNNPTYSANTVLVPLLPGEDDLGNPTNGIEKSFNVDPLDLSACYPVALDWAAPLVVKKVDNGNDFEFQVVLFTPSQPLSTTSMVVERDSEGRVIKQDPVRVNDDELDMTIGSLPDEYTLVRDTSRDPGFASLPTRGDYGLGESTAFYTGEEPHDRFVRPYRAVFESATTFRIRSPFAPIMVAVSGSESPISLDDASLVQEPPVGSGFEDGDDQAYPLTQLDIGRQSLELRRYFLPSDPSDGNDFDESVLLTLENDGGIWDIEASAEFVPDTNWTAGHVLELRLYVNGLQRRTIARKEVGINTAEPVTLQGDTLEQIEAGESLQVRVYTSGSTSVDISGTPRLNYVTFERVRK